MLQRDFFYSKLIRAAFVSFVIFTAFAPVASAQTTSSTVSSVKDDFVLEPGKIEIFDNPGASLTKYLTVTNRAANAVSFKVEVEDFIGSNDPNTTVVLLADDKSPYSFKGNLVPQITSFTLQPGEKIDIPVKINIPANQAPGGYYASVLVSNQPSVLSESSSSAASGQTKIISRVGTLFFIRVNGPVNESGSLDDFKITNPTKDNPDYKFSILFKNSGTVHLVPFGYVTVTNILGNTVGKIPVDAYFALPNSLRYRDVDWKAPFLFGRYQARVDLNRGYGNNIDSKTITFWVIPWTILLMIIGGILLISFIIFFFSKNFEIDRKKS